MFKQTYIQDSSTLAVPVLTYSHHEIHGGSSFFIREFTDVANDADREYIIATPNTTKWCHFVIQVSI